MIKILEQEDVEICMDNSVIINIPDLQAEIDYCCRAINNYADKSINLDLKDDRTPASNKSFIIQQKEKMIQILEELKDNICENLKFLKEIEV